MLPILQVGPLALQTPGLALLIGLWLGISLAEKNSNRHGISASHLYNLIFIGLIAGIIGARLVYALRFPAAFSASPISLLSLNPGLLDITGGVTVGILSAFAYAQRKHLPSSSTLDALTPALAVFMVASGLAHFTSGAAYGSPSSLPWAVNLWGQARHPSQVYEILAAILVLALLWPGKERLKAYRSGDYFLHFTALSAAARLLLEAWRGDSSLLPGGLHVAQVLAWLVLALCLWIWNSRRSRLAESSDE